MAACGRAFWPAGRQVWVEARRRWHGIACPKEDVERDEFSLDDHKVDTQRPSSPIDFPGVTALFATVFGGFGRSRRIARVAVYDLFSRYVRIATPLSRRNAQSLFATIFGQNMCDGRELTLSRYTQPEAEHRMLLDQLRLSLPGQPPPKITAAQAKQATAELAL
jgi:hypothetical protein